jgi:NAD(P)-dependent dehydrogenase (short-subunit alcohol dehydrogenase family)
MYSIPDIADVTTEQFDRTIKTNIYGTFWMTKFAVPHIPKGGSIIVTASQVRHPLFHFAATLVKGGLPGQLLIGHCSVVSGWIWMLLACMGSADRALGRVRRATYAA